jgi:multidrug efflux pump subunit AcrA (membrane-fusion protein)
VLWIPEAAAQKIGPDRAMVWVIDPVSRTADQREIVLGAQSREGLRPVFDGLRPGENVVVEGAGQLKPGMRVTATRERTS